MIGLPAPMIADATLLPSVLLAWSCMFYLPYDAVGRVYQLRQLRSFWQAVGAVQAGISACSAVAAARAANPALGMYALLILGILATSGGFLAVELSNALLLPLEVYGKPMDGPAPGALLGVLGTALYVTFATPVVLGPAGEWMAYFGAPDALIPPAPLPHGRMQAIIVLLLVAINYGVPGPAIMRGAARILSAAGVVPTLVPADIGTPAGEAPTWGQSSCFVAGMPWPLDTGIGGYYYEKPVSKKDTKKE